MTYSQEVKAIALRGIKKFKKKEVPPCAFPIHKNPSKDGNRTLLWEKHQ
jgi:hypothetical protein